MSLFLLNILLAVGFMFILGTYNMSGLLAGLVVGYAALWATRPLYEDQRYFKRLPKAVMLILFFFKELILSNMRVLWDVVTPSHISHPGIVGVPLDARTDLEIMLVANLISLTPGTLSVDLSPDRKILYVHVMFLEDIEEVRKALKDGLERRVLEVLR